MTSKPSNLTLEPVSRYFTYDWQYAADIFNATAARFLSLLVLTLPILIDTAKRLSLSIPAGLWYSALAFIIAWVLFYIRCPQFVREYRDYGQYRAKGNSHRWIVWEFFNNLKSLTNWRYVIGETIAKGLSVQISCVKSAETKSKLEGYFKDTDPKDDISVYGPVNINRDIYVPIHLEDREKYVLCMEEDDRKLPEKEKELFWILYTEAVKERVLERVIVWALLYAAIILFLVSMVIAIKDFVQI